MTRDELRSALMRREEGLLADHEWQAVQEELASKPAAREVLVEVQLLSTELRRQLRSARLPSRRSRKGIVAVTGIVAAAAIVAIFVIRRSPQPQAWVGATVTNQDGKPSQVTPGQPLIAPPAGRAELRRRDGVAVVLTGGARSTVGGTPSGWTAPLPTGAPDWLAVESGAVEVDWPSEVPAAPAIVAPLLWVQPIPPAEFVVRVTPSRTEVQVLAGAVHVTRHQEGDRVRVSASDQALVVTQDVPVLAAGADRAGAEELAMLRRAPRELLLAPLRDARTRNALGGSTCYARGGLDALVVAAALDRTDVVPGTVAQIEGTLARQGADGSLPDELYCQAYYLAHLSHGLLLLRASPKGGDLARDALTKLSERIDRWATWLALPEQQRELDRSSRGMTSRLAYFAVAFALTGELLGDRADLRAVGRRYVDETLALQRDDGAFLIDGRHDSGYQGNTLCKLWWLALRVPHPQLEERLRLGGRWLLGRIDERGELDVTGNARTGRCSDDPDGRCRAPNVDELTCGLVYHAARVDPAVFEVVTRLRQASGLGAGD